MPTSTANAPPLPRDRDPHHAGALLMFALITTFAVGAATWFYLSTDINEKRIFLQQCVNGLSWGAIYALIAVGYTMVYGVLQLINFAHGDVYMVGAMTGFYAAGWLGLGENPTWVGFLLLLLAAMIVCCVLGFLIERVAYRPLRNQPRLNALITAIGVSMFLEFGGQRVFGATPKAFPAAILPLVGQQWVFSGIVITGVDLLIFGLTLVLMLILWLLVMHTRTGMALRAVSHRFDTASLMGINPDRIISFAFILGSALAAVAGILVAFRAPKIDPLMGLIPGIKAFVAAVLGGIGSIPGAVAGGLLLGLTEVFVAGYLDSQYRDAVAFVILIVILLVKPSGLFGQNVVEKV
jgi:branched-chain amino acid transport system permease protein